MAEGSSQSLTIAAAPARILAVIGDFPSYPEWAESVTRCEVIRRHRDGSAAEVGFAIDAGMIKDEYVLAYTWHRDGLGVEWALVSSLVQRSQNGSYRLATLGEQTEVTYSLSVGLTLPLLAIFRRRAEQAIMDQALRSLKARVEGGR